MPEQDSPEVKTSVSPSSQYSVAQGLLKLQEILYVLQCYQDMDKNTNELYCLGCISLGVITGNDRKLF